MITYIFQGVVLPERAQVTNCFEYPFEHLLSGKRGIARVHIILNQITLWIESDQQWEILDLRNVVKNIINNELTIISYIKGYAYEFEITRVINQSAEIDHVFGVEIPCIEERGKDIDLNEIMPKLREKIVGSNGVFLNRCFGDFVSAMKNADDTSFYCYRAIESLRHHCAALHNLTECDKSKQWQKLREVCGVTENSIREIKEAADPLRHGRPNGFTNEEREKFLTTTWEIIDSYLNPI